MSRVFDVSKLKPVSDRVIIKPDPKSDMTESGILKPKEAIINDHIMTGEVVAVGEGKNGIPMVTKKGDFVMYPEHTGTEIAGGYLIMQEPQILSII